MKCHRCGKDNPAEIHTCTPLALRLVDKLMDGMNDEHWNQLTADAAAELRRLHAENEALRSALEHPSDHLEQHLEMVPAELRAENEALRAQNKEFRDVLAAACDSLGSFVSDHGWSDLDMQIFDNVCAALARAGEVK